MSRKITIPANQLELLIKRADRKITIDSTLIIEEDEDNFSMYAKADIHAVLISRVPKRINFTAPNQTQAHSYSG